MGRGLKYGCADQRSDTELLGATRDAPEAFGVFYERHFSSVISFFWNRTRDPHDAAELTAETFAAAIGSLDRFDPSRGSPSQWLYGIAQNKLRQFWRHKQVSDRARTRLRIQTPETPTSGWAEMETADARLDSGRLASALARVPARNREAVRLRVLDQLSYAEISIRLDCKPGAARTRVLRGLRRLEFEFEHPTASEAEL